MTPPIRLIAVVLACWGAGRFGVLYFDAAAPEPLTIQPAEMIGGGRFAERRGSLVRAPTARPSGPRYRFAVATASDPARPTVPPLAGELRAGIARPGTAVTLPTRDLARARSVRRPEWRASAWIFWRPHGDTSGLTSNGQLGGSQLGFRNSLTLARAQQLSASASLRAYRSLRENDANVALGLMARLDGSFPVELILERRIALEADARGAWAVGLAGGTYAENLPLGFNLEGYFQAGIVGLVRHEFYADASIGASQPVRLSQDWSLSIGGMAWLSGQASLARFDVGPRASVALPVHRGTGRISLAWRQRISGNARPSSGPAVTLGIDF